MIRGMIDSGEIPVLQRLTQFTAARHRVLVDNIANFDTPGHRAGDLDPADFQSQLAHAVDARRATAAGTTGPLTMRSSRQLDVTPERLTPRRGTMPPRDDNVLFHDGNNRDVERTMQALAENTLMHNAAVDLMRSRVDLLRMAIRERV